MKNLLTILALLAGTALTAQEKGVTPVATPHSVLATPHSTRAVVVGISDYQEKEIPDLRFADRDAEAFANFLRSPAGGSLDGDHLQVLTNHNATLGNIAAALDWLLDASKEGDEAIIYFSGHGDVERKTISQPGYLLCWDAPARVYLAGGALALPMFQDVISTLSIQNKVKVIVITDACRSGKLSGSTINGAQATTANLSKQFGNEVKILSCQPDQYSIEGEQWGGGRGVFSYHLMDALYGMADANADGSVNLLEIGRYLEDHVTAEAAPQQQLPMVSGNKTESLFRVFPEMLAQVRKGKAGQMPVFAQTESRGLEEEVLATVDSLTRNDYLIFKKALAEKRFFADASLPSGEEADPLFEKLLAEPKLARLHPAMRRNYAAALQNDAQQAMNIWLKADPKELECIGKTLKLEPIPRQLARAAELLGEGHYMFKSLKGRQLYFEGYVMSRAVGQYPDSAQARKILGFYQKSLAFEPNSAIVFNDMIYLFGRLQNRDSAEICLNTAHTLAPNWVSPFINFYYTLTVLEGKSGTARQLETLDRAAAVDSLHGFVLNARINWLVANERFAEALEIYEKYAAGGGATWPCWYAELATIVGKASGENEQEKAQRFMENQVAKDSTSIDSWENLSLLYYQQTNLEKAILTQQKALALDSTRSQSWALLGFLEMLLGRYDDAEKRLKKGLQLDSTNAWTYGLLGWTYTNAGRLDEAEAVLNQGLALNPNDDQCLSGKMLNQIQLGNTAEANKWYQKAISVHPNNWLAQQHMAILALREGKTDEAFEWLEKALKNNGDYACMYYDPNLAPLRAMPQWQVLVNKHRPGLVKDRALRLLEAEGAKNPNSAETWAGLSQTYYIMLDYQKSAQAMRKAAALDPASTENWRLLGLVEMMAGNFAEAEAALKTGLRLDSTHIGCLDFLAFLFTITGRFDESESILKKNLALNPRSVQALAKMGLLHFYRGNTAEAKNWLQKSLDIDSVNWFSLQFMAATVFKEGKTDEAFDWLEKSMKNEAQFPYLDFIPYLAPLRVMPQWSVLVKKYYPGYAKD